MPSPLQWYQQQQTPIKAIIIFFLTLLVAFLIFWLAFKQMSGVAIRSMEPYATTDKVINKYFSTLEKPSCLHADHFNTFKKYQEILNTRKSHHLNVSMTFFRNYYGVLLTLMVLSCVGGVVLFILINKGWATAGIELQSFFLALALAVAFCGLFPSVFKQEENYNKNLAQYMEYTKSELNIVQQLSYLSTQCYVIAPTCWIILITIERWIH
jgi:hypothetical protein